jgi:hypothetical protein
MQIHTRYVRKRDGHVSVNLRCSVCGMCRKADDLNHLKEIGK